MSKGSKCQYSELGLKRRAYKIRKDQRTGVIVGESGNKTCWWIRWEGQRKSTVNLFRKENIEVLL